MDGLLKLIDALRERGAIEITTPEVSVKFAQPVQALFEPEKTELQFDKPLDAAEVEKMLYVETSRM